MALPLYGFLEGDTIGLLIVAEAQDTVETLATKLQEAANLRVAPAQKIQLVYKENILDPALTLAQAGLKPLERFDVVRR
jgi:hypothetical protein